MMQRPPHLDLFPSRHSQSPAPLPTPPTEQKTSSAILNSTFAKEPPAIMSPTTRFGSYGRRVSRSSFATSSSSDGAKSFVLDTDAHPNKYMHFYDRLDNKHGLAPPSQSEHQVKQDPTGTLKTWEYELPEFLWPPIRENAKILDPSLKIRWGRENGYVQITNIFKALLIPGLKISDVLRGYEEDIVRIRGGQIEVQGSWIPYELARKVCLEKCYKIRHYLSPLFGPDFVDDCIPCDQPGDRQVKAKPGRKPRSLPIAIKRHVDEEYDVDYHDVSRYERPRSKRRNIAPCASVVTTPPEIPFDMNIDHLRIDEICDALCAARELMRLSKCQPDGVAHDDWPTPNDSRMGGIIIYKGQRYHWDGADQLVPEFKAQTPRHRPSLPSVKELVDFPSSTTYNRFPITPSPHQSPFHSGLPYDWQNNAAAQAALISPPMSLRESFNGLGRERHFSIPAADGCRSPVQESYSGSLFPSPQPENRFEDGF